MEILRDFTIEFNIDTGKVEYENISFYNTDQNVSVLLVKLSFLNSGGVTEILKVSDSRLHNLVLHVKNPKDVKLPISGVVINTEENEDAIYRFDLDNRFISNPGLCSALFMDTFIESDVEKKVTSDSFAYTVKENPIVAAEGENPPLGVVYNPNTGNLDIIGISYSNVTGDLQIGGE